MVWDGSVTYIHMYIHMYRGDCSVSHPYNRRIRAFFSVVVICLKDSNEKTSNGITPWRRSCSRPLWTG